MDCFGVMRMNAFVAFDSILGGVFYIWMISWFDEVKGGGNGKGERVRNLMRWILSIRILSFIVKRMTCGDDCF